MIYDIYIIQHLYNPASTQHQVKHQHSIMHSMYIRYFFINTISLMLKINTLSLHRKIFRWRAYLAKIDFLLAVSKKSFPWLLRTMKLIDGVNIDSSLFLNINNKLPGFVAVTGFACSGFPEDRFTSGGLFTLNRCNYSPIK